MANTEKVNITLLAGNNLSEMMNWANSTINGVYNVRCDDMLLGRYTFTFNNPESALVFKLRWI